MLGWRKSRSSEDENTGNKTAAGAGKGPAEAAPRLEQIELQLLQGVRRRQQDDFEALYRLYHPRLTRFLAQFTRRGEVVDEVLDDTMMVVWERSSSFDGHSKLSTWIFGIAYR